MRLLIYWPPKGIPIPSHHPPQHTIGHRPSRTDPSPPSIHAHKHTIKTTQQVGIDLRNFSVFMADPYESLCPCRQAVKEREAQEAADAAKAGRGCVRY
jgi:hypothetical protein